MMFDPQVIIEKLPEISSGLLVTLSIWIVSIFGGIVFGFLIAAARRFGGRSVSIFLGTFVEVFRGTPFLIQIFLLYYGGPFVGIMLDPIPCGLLGLTVYASAYYSEVFRGGFASVPRGHVEAAECLGMSRVQTILRIQIPEMALIVFPPAINLAILLLKESAVLSIITVPELTATVSAIGSQQYAFLEAVFILAVTYWVIVELTDRLGRLAERRISRLRVSNA